MMDARVRLPIDEVVGDVVAAMGGGGGGRSSGNLVLVAEPGAGKTTRVAPAIFRSGILGENGILMLQPRRVAARASAERIAEENGWRLGEEVGYQVRFERRVGPRTRIKVVTEAILARQLLSDPELSGVGCVILDEFHERSIHSDLAIALLREVQQAVRPDLKIVVMSATMDAEAVAAFLGRGTGGEEGAAKVIRVPGRTFPVDVEYRVPRTGGRVEELAAEAVRAVMSGGAAQGRAAGESGQAAQEGDVLCFLPGAEEIRRTGELLRWAERGGEGGEWEVLPLHGSLSFEEQRRALMPSARGRRKVILATNIAETSLTIEGVTTVVDSGLAREAGFDVGRGVDRLSLRRISRASAAQRAGRAGRTRPGRCVRLWTAREQAEMAEFDVPELHRVDLAPTLLTLMAWGVGDVKSFGWFEPPAEGLVDRGLRLLERLGAVERVNGEGMGAGRYRVTAVGKRMAGLPVHPRVARLLVAARDAGMEELGAAVAAIVSEKDFRYRGRGAERGPREVAGSDVEVRLDLLGYAERRGFHPSLEGEGIDVAAARQVARTRDELLSRIRTVRRQGTGGESGWEDWVVRAYPDRVCVRRESDATGASAVMVGEGGAKDGGVGVVLAPESAVRQGRLFVAVEVREDDRATARQATVYLAHGVSEEALRAAFPRAFTRGAMCTYDAEKDKVVGRVQTRYLGLVLEERDDARVEDDAAAEALTDAVLPGLTERLLRDEEAVQLMGRLMLARRWVATPAGAAWPEWESGWGAYREKVKEAMRGCRQLAEFSAVKFLRSLLEWPLDRLLEEQVPARWEVPTGNRIAIDYSSVVARSEEPGEGVGKGGPRLAVRLQEMFGARETPRVCGGRVAVTLELLSPGYKPVQVTQDLVSFWGNTYEQVRKDLRARYPKHSWPEDPTSAVPVAKGRSERR